MKYVLVKTGVQTVAAVERPEPSSSVGIFAESFDKPYAFVGEHIGPDLGWGNLGHFAAFGSSSSDNFPAVYNQSFSMDPTSTLNLSSSVTYASIFTQDKVTTGSGQYVQARVVAIEASSMFTIMARFIFLDPLVEAGVPVLSGNFTCYGATYDIENSTWSLSEIQGSVGPAYGYLTGVHLLSSGALGSVTVGDLLRIEADSSIRVYHNSTLLGSGSAGFSTGQRGALQVATRDRDTFDPVGTRLDNFEMGPLVSDDTPVARSTVVGGSASVRVTVIQ